MKPLSSLFAILLLASCGNLPKLSGEIKMEAETLRTDGTVLTDATASGGESVNLWQTGESVTAELPKSGTYQVSIRAKATYYKNWPRLKLSSGQEIEIDSDVYKNFEIDGVNIGEDKTLSATYTNDEYGGAGNDKNAYIDNVTLALVNQITPTPPLSPIPKPIPVPTPVPPPTPVPTPIPPTPTPTPSPTPAPSTAKDRLKNATGFAVRYSHYGTDRVSAIANDPCDVIVLSPVLDTTTTPFTTWTRNELEEIKRRSPNKILLAYINEGHTHKQSVVAQKMQALYGKNFENFPNLGYNSTWNNYIADTHATFWQDLKKEEINILMTLGFDGIFYDDAWQQNITAFSPEPQSTLPGGNGALQLMQWAKNKYPNIINMTNPGGHYAAATFYPDGIQNNNGTWVGKGNGHLAANVLDAVYFESLSYSTGGAANNTARRDYLVNTIRPLVVQSGVLDYWCDYTANDTGKMNAALSFAKSIGLPLRRYRLDNGSWLNTVVGSLLE